MSPAERVVITHEVTGAFYDSIAALSSPEDHIHAFTVTFTYPGLDTSEPITNVSHHFNTILLLLCCGQSASSGKPLPGGVGSVGIQTETSSAVPPLSSRPDRRRMSSKAQMQRAHPLGPLSLSSGSTGSPVMLRLGCTPEPGPPDEDDCAL